VLDGRRHVIIVIFIYLIFMVVVESPFFIAILKNVQGNDQ